MPEDIQMRFANLPSRQMDDLQPSDGSGAFLADILALPAGQVQQKIIKASIAAIGPVKLTVLPDQPPGRLEKRKLRLLYKGRVGRSEEHTSELQSLMRISYAVFCLKKKKTIHNT